MDDKQFDEMFQAVHGVNRDDRRMAEIKKILEGLLRGEFESLAGRHIRLKWMDRDARGLARVWTLRDVSTIEFSRDVRDEHFLDLARHELLHLEMNRGDLDPLFSAECRKRKIEIWNLDENDLVAM